MEEYQRFLAVVENRSISHAAESLGVSQPTLSRTIRLLEQSYGAPLFIRTGQGVELSEAGQTLFLHASRAVRAIQSAREEIGSSVHTASRVIRLCSGDSWGYGILPAAIARFGEEYPDVAVHLDVTELEARMRGLDTRRYELAFGVISAGYSRSGKYSFDPIVRARYDVYCDKGHELLKKKAVMAEDLLRQSWINHQFEYDYDPMSLTRTSRRYVIRTNAMISAIETMRTTQLLLSTAKTLREQFARAGIVPLVEDREGPEFVSGVIAPKETDLRPIVRRFLTIVRSHCQAMGLAA